jgi:hypothetical protein
MMQEPAADALSQARAFLSQRDVQQRLATAEEGPWTTLWEDWHSDDASGGYYSALSDPARRDRTLSNADWDLAEGEGLPGFTQYRRDGDYEAVYLRYGTDDGVEPLVIIRQWHGVLPDEYLISEGFVLLMKLWRDPDNGQYYSVSEDGTRDIAIEITSQMIRVRTPLLRRYQAARQKDLLIFVDSRRFVRSPGTKDQFSDLKEKEQLVNTDTVQGLAVGSIHPRRIFSRFLAKRVLAPPPQEECGIWPWEADDDYFPEFTVGESDTGQPQLFSCNPDELGNYFGANPDAPHYLTPVFFRKSVLQRYYDDPVYEVSAGRLSCGTLWGVQIDNHSPDFVMVFLGDIGRDIPKSHRDHWRAYNVPPTSGMSEATYRQSFLAQFAESSNPEEIFKRAYNRLNESWLAAVGWPLFREPHASDAHALDRLRIPLNELDAEFEAQILLLCKVMVDQLNEKQLIEDLPKVSGEKGISKLQRYLTEAGYPHVDRDIAFMRRLQELRSKISAHSKGSDYKDYIRNQLKGGSKAGLVRELMKDAIIMTEGLTDYCEIDL